MSSDRKDTTHIIPVVFEVTTETVTQELEAAGMLAAILADRKLVGAPRYGRSNPQGRIESWHMQNHPAADGSDHEAAILFVPVARPPRWEGLGGNDDTPHQMQRAIDEFLRTTGRWLNDG